MKDVSVLIIERVRKNAPGPGTTSTLDLTVDLQVSHPCSVDQCLMELFGVVTLL
jgi:hypothetical protein